MNWRVTAPLAAIIAAWLVWRGRMEMGEALFIAFITGIFLIIFNSVFNPFGKSLESAIDKRLNGPTKIIVAAVGSIILLGVTIFGQAYYSSKSISPINRESSSASKTEPQSTAPAPIQKPTAQVPPSGPAAKPSDPAPTPTMIAEPVVEMAIGEPFGSKTIIIVKNSGIEPIVSVSVNLRCFLLERSDDPAPALLFTGFPSIGNANSWWSIDVLGEGKDAKKDSMEVASNCLKNSEKLPGPYNMKLFAADLSYSRKSDHKQYTQTKLVQLLKKNDTEDPFTWPVPMSDYYRQILQDRIAPQF